MKRILACCPLLAVLCFQAPGAAQAVLEAPARAVTRPVAPLLGLNLEYGGDEVLELLFENGNTQKMRAGQGVTLFGGARIRLIDQLDLDASIGVKYVTTAADNLDLRFLRFPVEAMLRYEVGSNVFISGGVTKHINNTFKVSAGDGILAEGTQAFTSNLGYRVEAGWRFVGLSYTVLKYRTEVQPREEIGANTVGMVFRYGFGG